MIAVTTSEVLRKSSMFSADYEVAHVEEVRQRGGTGHMLCLKVGLKVIKSQEHRVEALCDC